jgi:succinate dehydrogenase / fumarate reductase membrane anchor subunit
MVTPQRIPVGAHYGWRDWLAQRVTAVVMVAYTLLIMLLLLWHGGLDYAGWKATFANEPFRLSSFAFMAAVLWHSWIGLRNITMDYLKPVGLRLCVQVLVIAALVAYAGWSIQILWGHP